MSNRVDKQWKDKGLTGYSTEAILGTLTHYGVTLDEAGFKSTASDKFPLELAIDWKPKWKGTGQFATYPYAAANELFGRLLPQKPAPMKAATHIIELIAHSLKVISAQPDADLGAAFGRWDELVAILPPVGERRDAFMREFVTFIESWAKTFNEMPERLAKAGHAEHALRFAKVHEVLFTDREGCMTALVRAHTGDRPGAVADLAKWSGDTTRDVFARYSALDSLLQLDEFDQVKQLGLGVFDAAAEAKSWGLADSIAHMLGHLVQQGGADPMFIREVKTRLDRAHAHTGGHH